MASSTVSTASSGYSSQVSTYVNPQYACFWLDSCCGRHELNDCSHWEHELNGKKGIYYNSNGMYKRFSRDDISYGTDLGNNRTGCTTVYLLIYRVTAQNEREILLGLQSRKEKDDGIQPRELLVFPWAKPFKRGVSGKPFALRAFKSVSDREDIFNQSFQPRFLFQHASVIYPLHLTEKQADTVSQSFKPNDILLSLHWFPLANVLAQLPAWKKYLISEETPTELAQHQDITPIGIRLGSHDLWSGTARSLMCIREHVPDGFETFLRV